MSGKHQQRRLQMSENVVAGSMTTSHATTLVQWHLDAIAQMSVQSILPALMPNA